MADEAMISTLTLPSLVGGRDHAREIVALLPDDLSDHEVVIDCVQVEASPPSFVDEMVKVLVGRGVRLLTLHDPPERTATYALRAAAKRGVTSRVAVRTRTDDTSGGIELTDKRIQQLADQAERGYRTEQLQRRDS